MPSGGTDEDCSGDDADLKFPEHVKTLIISEDLDSTDPDDADANGSFIEFDFFGFTGNVTIDSIDVGDVDELEFIDAFINFHGGSCSEQSEIGTFFDIPPTGDNEIETILIGASAGIRDAQCVQVRLNGSGTVDNIKFTVGPTPAPAIDIEKATNGEDADEATGPVVAVGSTVEFSYQVTNTGDVDLSNVTVVDDQVSVPATGSASATIDFEGLAEGEIVTELSCGSGISCSDGDLGGGPVLVRAHNPAIDDGNTNTAMIFNSDCAALVDCTGEDDDLSFPGHGNTMIISEDLDQTHPDDQIEPGSFMEFDFSGFGPGGVTVHSLDAGDIEEREIRAFVEGSGGPCIGIETGSDDIPIPLTGNNGIETVNFELSGVHCLLVHLNGSGVVENIEFTTAVAPAPAEVAVSCPQDTLAVGESMTCSGSTTATAGQYTNLGTACGDGAGQNVCDTDPSNHFGSRAAIDIEKATNGQDADDPTGPVVLVGSTVNFTYLVSNTGNVALANVVVTDDNGTPGNPADDFAPAFVRGDTNSDGKLDVVEIWLYQARGTVKLGQYANIGEACGNGAGQNVCDTDLSHHFGKEEAAFTGCTPGFWKNHTKLWDDGEPDLAPSYLPTTFMSVALGFDALVPAQGGIVQRSNCLP